MIGDKGYQGMQKVNSHFLLPIKEKQGGLSQAEKNYNTSFSKVRLVVEHKLPSSRLLNYFLHLIMSTQSVTPQKITNYVSLIAEVLLFYFLTTLLNGQQVHSNQKATCRSKS
ncbi:Hypothetical_protein [Hexamita inflata]|uniref:Hypothetical_protein n=1 Tax=Hexamita inflata TaxID=28002 RepID=A0AA86QM24_9EUKA|nr:Hypothetical protein HINF_LOCUS48433 [Hexamita inflata]